MVVAHVKLIRQGAKMRTKLKIIPYFILLFLVFCSKDNNPINTTVSDTTVSEDKYNKLSITTDTTTYTWQQGESHDHIIIQGAISNESDTVFYSRLGDGFALFEQERLYIASFSDGYIEKHSESDNSWKEREFLAPLFEGVRVVSIRPSKDYSISGLLSKSRDESETGKYRIRIDYYDIENPDSTVTPFHDYSNTFELQ